MVKNSQALYDYLLPFVTANKQEKFSKMLSQRTRALTVVLEDIFKSHNASAVLRTAECLGIQDVHIVEQENAFDLNPYVLRGSGKWLTIHHHRKSPSVHNIGECFRHLKEEGYRILATSPHGHAVNYSDLEMVDKTAVVFGAEENGVSEYALKNADQLIKIPMYGFTESFNISVSAGIILEYYNSEIRKRLDWQLSDIENEELTLEWMQKVVPNIDKHMRQFNKQLIEKPTRSL